MNRRSATKAATASAVAPRDAARRFALAAAALAADTRCINVVLLDLAGLSAVTDFFILATGTSARQMGAVADQVDELALQHGYRPFTRSGYPGQTWIAVDYIDVVLHIFSAETRAYYDLDNLWGDALRVPWPAKK